MLKSVTELSFNKYIGIQPATTGCGLLQLPAGEQYQNHLGTVHAGAQLALAEACSGEFLLRHLDVDVNLVPVVRSVEAKFKKPARGKVTGSVVTQPEELAHAREMVLSKGRSLVTIVVELHDEFAQHSLTARFEWFLARVS